MLNIGIDIGGTKTVIGLVGEHGRILAHSKILSAAALATAGNPAEALANAIRSFVAQHGVTLAQVRGIGIGIPGVIDRATDSIANCPNLGVINGYPLGAALTAQLGLPAFIENDVNLIALGEHLHGRGRGVDNLAAIYVGSGLGCGLIVNHRLYVGSDGAAGEFGHIVIEPDGLVCTCGGIGCLEMYCSGKALAVQAPRLLGRDSDGGNAQADDWSAARLVLDAARAGHPQARAAVDAAFQALGIGLTTLVNVLNPRLILLGGGIVTAWPEGVDTVREIVRRRARTIIRERLEFATGTLGEDAGLIGAAMLVDQRLSTYS